MSFLRNPFLLVLLSILHYGHCDTGTALFEKGKEYVYGYSASLIAGSKDYVSFASAVNITGELHIQGGASVANVQLNNVQLGLYNGEWQLSPLPEFERKAFPQLASDSKDFAMQLSYNDGKVNSVSLNQNSPAWTNNVMKSVASSLLNGGLDAAAASTESDANGECPTIYQSSGSNYTKVKDLTNCSGTGGSNSNQSEISQTATQTCSQIVSNGILQSVNCTENRVINRFADTTVLAVARSVLHLKNITQTVLPKRNFFKAVQGVSQLAPALSPTSIKFQDIAARPDNSQVPSILAPVSKLLSKLTGRKTQPKITEDRSYKVTTILTSSGLPLTLTSDTSRDGQNDFQVIVGDGPLKTGVQINNRLVSKISAGV